MSAPDPDLADLLAEALDANARQHAALLRLQRYVAEHDTPRRLLKIGEIQKLLGCSETTARRLAAKIGFQAVTNGPWFVDAAALERGRS